MTSCSSPEDKGTLNSEPDFVGFVTMIERDGTGEVVGHITVESHANKLVHRYVVTLTKQTALLRREGEALHPVDVDAFKLKDWVKLWFSGSRKEPSPLDVTARQVVIVDRP